MNQQQSTIGATASGYEGPRVLENHPDETPQAERTSRGRRVQSSRKRLENKRVAGEARTQKEVREARALQKKAVSGPGRPNLDTEGWPNIISV